jgi:hypothetical protein
MKEPEITINVGEITLDTVVSERYTQTGEEDYDAGPVTLAELVAEIIADRAIKEGLKDGYQSLVSRVADIRDQVIREKVEPIVDDALTKPFRRTNTYGDPTGKETNLKEIIIDDVGKQLSTGAGVPHRSYDSEPPLKKFIRNEIEGTLRKDLSEALNTERKKVITAVRAEGTKLFSEMLERGVRAL